MSEKENTHADLGEDLLSAEPQGPNKTQQNPRPTSIHRALVDAKISINERLFHQAKKLCHWILSKDSSHFEAKETLQKIFELEIEELISKKSPSRIYWETSSSLMPQVSNSESSNWTAQALLEDLGCLSEDPTEREELESHILNQIKSNLETLESRDQLDLAIAFYEMKLFQAAQKLLHPLSNKESEQQISATLLLAQTHFEKEEFRESILTAESILNLEGITQDQRKHFFYLIGLCQEKLGRSLTARQWFRQVALIDPDYRDAKHKIEEDES